MSVYCAQWHIQSGQGSEIPLALNFQGRREANDISCKSRFLTPIARELLELSN